MKTTCLCGGVGLSLLALAAMTAPVVAQDELKLKLAHGLPATHYAYVQGIKKFEEAVTQNSNGKVTFEVYPASQLGKDSYSVVSSGLADIAMIVTSYAPDKFPLTSVTELPGLFTTSCEAMHKYFALADEGGILDEKEYKPLGIKVLFVSTLPQYNFTTVSKQVSTLDEVAGLKVFANGAAMDKTARALGAVPVRLTASELFDAVSRGTVDGALFPYSSLAAYKLSGHIKYSLEGAALGSASWILAMSEKRWNELSDDVKKAIDAAGLSSQEALCQFMDEDHAATRERLKAEHDLTVTQLSDEQVKLWKEKLDGVSANWAAEMDAQGRDGTAVLEAMRKADAGQ
jgi:TRAP-type C4-dicarboxylate transport system substrate-binding protein